MDHICRYCGKSLTSRSKKYRHIHEEHKDELPQKGSSWNKGKTKENCEIIKQLAVKLATHTGQNNSFYGKHHTLATKKRLSKFGGFRLGAGRGKKGWYKGYYCDSSWELAFVMYNLDHHISFKRNTEAFEYIFKGKIRKYIPDWLIGDKYVEIKGYWSKQWQAKLDQFPKNKTIEVIDKFTIAPYLEYAIQHYGENFISSYDGYCPKKQVTRIKKKSPITLEEFNKRKALIMDSGIDLSKYGGITQVSKNTGLSIRQIYYIIHHCPNMKTLHSQ